MNTLYDSWDRGDACISSFHPEGRALAFFLGVIILATAISRMAYFISLELRKLTSMNPQVTKLTSDRRLMVEVTMAIA